jgi:cell volume regulation protein A
VCSRPAIRARRRLALSWELPVDALVLFGALLLGVGVLASSIAGRIRVPAFLLFIAIGMVLGDDGLAIVRFDDEAFAQSLAVVALVLIIFEGGLTTDARALRRVVAPSLLLATVGVVVTAALVGVAAALVLDLPVVTAALIGAALGSTDAAAVFAVMRRVPVTDRLGSLLEAESGLNDPVAVLLTAAVLETWLAGDLESADIALFAVQQLVVGGAVGAFVGWGGGRLVGRATFAAPVTAAVLVTALGGVAYGSAASLGGSGFLAVYLAGIGISRYAPRYRRSIRTVHSALASAAQVALFLLLGFLVFPSELPPVILPAIVVAVVLVLVARPVAVWLCLPWFGFSQREMALTSWSGLRGAVPVVLTTFAVTTGYGDGERVFDVVFVVVLLASLTQGLTLEPLARRLGLLATGHPRRPVLDAVPLDSMSTQVLEVELWVGAGVVGRSLAQAPPPVGYRVATIVRGSEAVVPDGSTVLDAGDLVVLVAPVADDASDVVEAWADDPAESG